MRNISQVNSFGSRIQFAGVVALNFFRNESFYFLIYGVGSISFFYFSKAVIRLDALDESIFEFFKFFIHGVDSYLAYKIYLLLNSKKYIFIKIKLCKHDKFIIEFGRENYKKI